MHKRHYEKYSDGSVKDIDDEIPFDVPDGWSWCRFFEIADVINGKNQAKVENPKGEYPIYGSGGIIGYADDYICPENCTIIGRKGSINNPIFVETKFWNVDTAFGLLPGDFLLSKYLFYFCQNFDFTTLDSSTTLPSLTKGNIQQIFFPLPPLSEQQLIVEEIEKIFAQIDLLEQNKTDLQTAIKHAKSKILDLAIHGKLVPQDVNDEPASVLLEKIRAEKEAKIANGELKRDKNDSYIYKSTTDNCHYQKNANGSIVNIEDEIPFEVPDGWSWCRLGEITSELGDGIHGTPEYDPNGDYFFVNGNNLCNGKIIIKEDTKRVSITEFNKYKKNLNEKTVFVSINGTLGNVAFYNNESIILGKSACYLNLFKQKLKLYIFALLNSEYFKKYSYENATGSTIKNVSLKSMRDFLIPLPPLTEQTRIVAKIEELFTLLDNIQNNLI